MQHCSVDIYVLPIMLKKFGLETCVGLPVVFLGKALYSPSTILHTGE